MMKSWVGVMASLSISSGSAYHSSCNFKHSSTNPKIFKLGVVHCFSKDSLRQFQAHPLNSVAHLARNTAAPPVALRCEAPAHVRLCWWSWLSSRTWVHSLYLRENWQLWIALRKFNPQREGKPTLTIPSSMKEYMPDLNFLPLLRWASPSPCK